MDEHGRVTGYHDLSNISESLKSILIRRTKKEVLKELPERLEKNYFVPMTPQQMDYHEENRKTVARIVAKWRRFGFLSETDQRILMIALQNMRMSCNSTYLLDKKTDFGTKADELIELLDEVFEHPEAKAVVFSQWLGTHEILLDRLQSARHGYVLFHGGIAGPKRKGLIGQFKEDPKCRVFLSTDAGGVGLNLQNASTVVNMDLPWNPAVLEQRIGRIHRLGQRRPVRVVNFVAQGTVEHGMLSLLSFKQSLFAGVLDKGQDEVFLGGTRLKRFMESVDKATGAIPEPMPPKAEAAAPPPQPKAAGPQEVRAWDDLISAGVSFLNQLGRTLAGGGGKPVGDKLGIAVESDPATSQRSLRVPIPPKETLERLADLLHEWAKKI